MNKLLLITMILFSSISAADECSIKIEKYLNLADKNPNEALNKYLEDKDECEDRDVTIGTFYVATGNLDKGEEYYKKSITEEKSLEYAYWQLAGLELSRGNIQKVIDYCQASLKIKKNYMCYRHTAIAYAVASQHDLVRDYYGAAYELNANALADTDLMGAAAFAYTELGEYDLAKGVITLGVQNNPEANKNPMFVQAYKNLKNKIGE